jgi:hypothetical protein
MIREDLAACALRTLPASIRDVHGEEILGTLLDRAGTGSRTRFVRELADLVSTGLRAHTVGRDSRRLVADGFCRGAMMVMTLDLSTLRLRSWAASAIRCCHARQSPPCALPSRSR